MGVKRRLQRLIQQNGIKVTTLINPFFFKLYPAIVLLEMESAEDIQRLLERFKDCPRVIHIFKNNRRLQPNSLSHSRKPRHARKHIHREMLAKKQHWHTQIRILPNRRNLLYTIPSSTGVSHS